ncbi:hypothetical protein KFE25_006067 [Diacronema lutheri]|nr:hypothetical protein KFE25_006067 [Diacronema lutheri]
MDAVSGSDRPIKKLLSDLQFLGPLRFIVQGSGAILESVAEVGSVTYKVLDSGAELATLKADTGSSDFEAHVRLSEVSGARFETKDKADGKTLFLIRLINQQGAPALTCLLQAESDDGDYDPSAVQFYNGLRDHFGESFIA